LLNPRHISLTDQDPFETESDIHSSHPKYPRIMPNLVG